MTFEHKSVEELSTNFEPDGLFMLETHNGSIKIIGVEKNGCEVAATIHAKAQTEDEARQLAVKVKVDLELDGKKLIVRTQKPELSYGQSISIDFDVKVPLHTTLNLICHNGKIYISNTSGDIDGTTYNGSINIEKFSGKKTNLKTHNGAVEVCLTESYDDNPDLIVETHNGSICLNVPSALSAKISILANNGSISSNLPMTITKNTRTELQGVVRDGTGKINLRTYNGSIKIN